MESIISQDGLHWNDLNIGQPGLKSAIGEKDYFQQGAGICNHQRSDAIAKYAFIAYNTE